MRKLTALALVFATTFAMANNGQEENVKPTTTQQTEQVQLVSYDEIFKRTEDEGLICAAKTKNGDYIVCILCDCEVLVNK